MSNDSDIAPEDFVPAERIGDERTGWQFIKTLTLAEAAELGADACASAMFGGPGPFESLRIIPLSQLKRGADGKLALKAV